MSPSLRNGPERLSVEEYRRLVAPAGKVRKYRNSPTIGRDGRRYDSKLEARHAAALEMQVRAGLIRAFIPQISIPVPGTDRRLRLDFGVIENDGRLRLQDTKGCEPTRDWKLKAELVERHYGLRIEVVRSA